MIHAMQQIDAAVWLRAARAVLLLVAALLMLKEPMMCGGRNQALHRLLSLLFAVFAWFSWSISHLRMGLVVLGKAPTVTNWDMAAEVATTAVCILLVVKLGYDYFLWRQFKALECQKSACDANCRVTTAPQGPPYGAERRKGKDRKEIAHV